MMPACYSVSGSDEPQWASIFTFTTGATSTSYLIGLYPIRAILISRCLNRRQHPLAGGPYIQP